MNRPAKSTYRTRAVMVAALSLLLAGCSADDFIAFFHLRSLVTFFTAGPIAAYERNMMLFTFGVMLFVLVPVVALTLWFAWRYRASNNQRSTYWPNWHRSDMLEWFLWGGPLVIIVILATLSWFTTYDMDPYKPIKPDAQAVEVQAIAMDWKWLFIYPQYNVAVVNEMPMKVDVPVDIHLTSATVMNAFMIPRLGSQIMAMSGMNTRLHLMATEKGRFFGKNYQYSGNGFAKMTFHAQSMSKKAFRRWVRKAKSADNKLDIAAYKKLVQPSTNVPVTYYSSVRPHLFRHVIRQFNSAGGNRYQAGARGMAAH